MCEVQYTVDPSCHIFILHIDGLDGSHVGWQEQCNFSPLGNEIYFHAKVELFLPSIMAAIYTQSKYMTYMLSTVHKISTIEVHDGSLIEAIHTWPIVKNWKVECRKIKEDN